MKGTIQVLGLQDGRFLKSKKEMWDTSTPF